MKLIDRARNIIVNPKAEWDVIAAESTPPAEVIKGYVLPLAAIAYIAVFVLVTLLFGLLFGARTGFLAGIVSMIVNIVMAVVSVLILAFIIDALAPTFGGQKSFPQAVKAAAYPFTPVWIAVILLFIPFLGALVVLAAVVYAFYIMYLGLPKVMKAPQEKAVGYLVVVIVCAIVLNWVIWMVAAGASAIFAPSAITLGGGSAASLQRESAMAKLDALGKKVDEANRKMEAAQKSGDSGKQAEAAMAALGTVLSGGKGVEPVTLDKLTPLVPEKFAGLARTDMRTDRSGVAGLMVAKAEATYGSGEKNVELEVVDTGGAAGLMGLASWMGVQGEREDSNRREVTRKEGNRLVHEQVDKKGGQAKYTVVVGERFVVSAEGNNVDLGTLKSGMNAVNLSALEGLK